MRELVVCSGKGGTGKTTVAAALASLAEDFVLADCDVDAANLHLVMDPVVDETVPFIAGRQAVIRPEDCLECGECRDLCRFDAIEEVRRADGGTGYHIDPLRCEGCGVCVHFCAADAIDFPDRRCGAWHRSRTAYGPMVHADLDVGAENSGKLVTKVREQARALAGKSHLDLILVDGPPGIGCPVTAAMTGADLTLLVTEPSLSGLHDLGRISDLAAHFSVPAMVCINKYDLSPRLTADIEEFCGERGLAVVGRLPFDPAVNEAVSAGHGLVEHAPHSEAAQAMTVMWHGIERRLAGLQTTKG